jgi:ribosome-binding protein aMBF1 (putative translation factor)
MEQRLKERQLRSEVIVSYLDESPQPTPLRGRGPPDDDVKEAIMARTRTHTLVRGGEAVREWCRAQGLRRESLCASLGISSGSLGAREIGASFPTLKNALAIERLTGIPVTIWVPQAEKCENSFSVASEPTNVEASL